MEELALRALIGVALTATLRTLEASDVEGDRQVDWRGKIAEVVVVWLDSGVRGLALSAVGGRNDRGCVVGDTLSAARDLALVL